jgi:hypothetical protein
MGCRPPPYDTSWNSPRRMGVLSSKLYIPVGNKPCLTILNLVYARTAGPAAELFAVYHKHSYCGCKPGVSDALMGIAALIAEYNNVESASHIQGKLTDIACTARISVEKFFLGLFLCLGLFSGFLVCEGSYVVCQFWSSYLVGYYCYG